MISEATLSLAVERGLITAEQGLSLTALEAERPEAAILSPDAEAFRFITGFADVFVVIGIGLFLLACGWFTRPVDSAPLTAAVVAALTWALAEFFTRRRRMAFPSIVLLVVFTASVYTCCLFLLGGPRVDLQDLESSAGAAFVAALIAATAAALHYWRFRVPITIAAGAAALVAAAAALFLTVTPIAWRPHLGWLVLVAGVGVFTLAMRFDLSDRDRVTRRTDIAFWLHLLAAPLIVHPLVRLMFGHATTPGPAEAVGLLALFGMLSVVALLVDRRALLVSGLIYAGAAVFRLFRTSGMTDATTPATLLVLGAVVLLLSAGWRPLRAGLLDLVPDRLAKRLPPANQSLARLASG